MHNTVFWWLALGCCASLCGIQMFTVWSKWNESPIIYSFAQSPTNNYSRRQCFAECEIALQLWVSASLEDQSWTVSRASTSPSIAGKILDAPSVSGVRIVQATEQPVQLFTSSTNQYFVFRFVLLLLRLLQASPTPIRNNGNRNGQHKNVQKDIMPEEQPTVPPAQEDIMPEEQPTGTVPPAQGKEVYHVPAYPYLAPLDVQFPVRMINTKVIGFAL
ncbi:hypothetical protein B566_EDAN009370 [Ephemera danica]|nr:hypothetical protein B566_EDAN009370 [Ephemera danica]